MDPMQVTGASNSEITGITQGVKSRTASSVHDIHQEKPPFGSRFLTNEADVWSKNAWDHVPPPEGQEGTIATALARQHASPVPEGDKSRYNERPERHWDNFYKTYSNNFFRDRKWLHLEFPDLVTATQPEAGPVTIAEIGCGAGNSVFPLLGSNSNPQLSLHAFDYSPKAVELVKTNPLYLSPPVGTIQAAVWDLSSDALPPNIEPESADVVVLIFVLSALHPNEWAQALRNVCKILKPGGLVLLRDYGRYDLTQLRFKSGRLLEENFYIRGDKTRVYFFELDELALLFTGEPVPSHLKDKVTTRVEEQDDDGGEDSPDLRSPGPSRTPRPSSPSKASEPDPRVVEGGSDPEAVPQTTPVIHPILQSLPLAHPLFAMEQLGVDRRLLVNRKRQLKMYRVWMQGKFRKLDKPLGS